MMGTYQTRTAVSRAARGTHAARRLPQVRLALLVLLCACTPRPPPRGNGPSQAREHEVRLLPLAGPLTHRHAEVSGMAWAGDELLLLPQKPWKFATSGADATFYAIPRASLLAAVDGATTAIMPRPVPVHAPGLPALTRERGFEGFEAIAISGDRVFLTLEWERAGKPWAELLTGRLQPNLQGITLDLATRRAIPGRSGVENMSEETLLVLGERVLTIHEVNGKQRNPSPVAHAFGTDLQPRGTLPFPRVEYRITDATPPDDTGVFWAINYFYPGEAVLRTDDDALAARFGRGPTHQRSDIVERLVAFSIHGDTLRLVDRPPLQLKLRQDGRERNWEAIAPLAGKGLLLATDMYPETLLGFVPLPPAEHHRP